MAILPICDAWRHHVMLTSSKDTANAVFTRKQENLLNSVGLKVLRSWVPVIHLLQPRNLSILNKVLLFSIAIVLICAPSTQLWSNVIQWRRIFYASDLLDVKMERTHSFQQSIAWQTLFQSCYLFFEKCLVFSQWKLTIIPNLFLFLKLMVLKNTTRGEFFCCIKRC